MSIEAMHHALEAAKELAEEANGNGNNWDQWCKPRLDLITKAIDQAEQAQPVGVVCIEHFRGCKSMENVDFQLMADLPPGSHLLYTTPPQRKPLKSHVLVPLDVLEAAERSLGSFCSDYGWADEDMQNMDNLSAYIAQHKAAHGIKEKING